jgi:uncharacterized repeat protein (TIGR02543 family)
MQFLKLNRILISANANPVNAGIITGTGSYNHNSTVNLVATANAGYDFVNWTEDGTEISTNPAYSFTATAERNLVANFATQSYAITAVANPVEGGTITVQETTTTALRSIWLPARMRVTSL